MMVYKLKKENVMQVGHTRGIALFPSYLHKKMTIVTCIRLEQFYTFIVRARAGVGVGAGAVAGAFFYNCNLEGSFQKTMQVRAMSGNQLEKPGTNYTHNN